MERKILARKSFVASIWLVTGKKVYQAITRGLFNFTDREGGGRRLVNDAPVLIELIRKNPDVRDTAIVAFADRRTGVGLYAFVEADRSRWKISFAASFPPPRASSRRSTSRSYMRCPAIPAASRGPRSCNSSR